MRASSTRISMADVLTQLHISRQGDWVFTHSVRLNTMQNQLRHDKWACQNASQDRKSSNFWFFPLQSFVWLMIEDTISGRRRRLIWVCHTDFKILSDTDDKAKEFIKTQLESWEEVLDMRRRKKILKSIKSWLAANCSLNNSSFWKRLFFVRIVT